jgi:dolichol-phosphate mannosyltransferase
MASESKRSLSMVFSFRNEEAVLTELIARVRNVLDKEDLDRYEMIFVNDDSTDRSEEILLDEAKKRNDIKIITMSRAFGVSPCVLAGMEYVTCDAAVYMDADLQDPPELISEMMKAWRNENADVVHTVRLSRAGESPLKLWITKLGYNILHYLTDMNLPLDAGDFKLLSRRVVDQVIRLREKKPFMRGLVCWVGFKQVKVYYHREARFAGETKFPILSRKVIRNFLDSAMISFSDLPLQFSLVVGLFVSFCALLMFLYIIFEKFMTGSMSIISAMICLMLFLGGIQLMTLGVMSLYLNSIFLETKNRPNYIVKHTYGVEKVPVKTDGGN